MTRKLVNIKNFLRIIISCFVIVNMAKSCAKAYTFDEFVAFSEQITELDEADSNTHLAARWLVSNADRIKSELASSINNFDTFIVWYTNNPTFYRFVGFQGGTFSGWKYSDTTSIITGDASHNGRSQVGSAWYKYIDGRNSTYRYGLFNETMAENIDFGNRIGNNYYITNTYYLGHMHSQHVSYSGEQLEAITLNYNFRSTFIESVVCEDTIITNMHASLDNIELECNNLGTYWNLVCPNSTLLKTKQIYTLNVESVIDGKIETLTERLIFFPPGTLIENGVIIRSPSGDYIFNTENATNQIIDNQNQNNNEIISTINNIVGNLPASTSGDASGDLSSGFDGGGGILGGIFSLFVPDGQFFKEYFEDLNNWFSDRLGLLYFPIELTIDFLTRCLNIDFTTQVLSVGPYVMPLNDNFELVPEIEIDFNSFLEDETVNSIHEVYLFITDGLIIFGLYRLIIKKYNNIVKNKGGG